MKTESVINESEYELTLRSECLEILDKRRSLTWTALTNERILQQFGQKDAKKKP